jgi:hypothetical protein
MKRLMWRIQRLEKRVLPQAETESTRALRQSIEAGRQRLAQWEATLPDISETESDRRLRRARLENLRTHLGIKGPVPLD